MKKIGLSFIFVAVAMSSALGKTNPMIGDYQNQIAFNFGQGIDSGFLVPPPFR